MESEQTLEMKLQIDEFTHSDDDFPHYYYV